MGRELKKSEIVSFIWEHHYRYPECIKMVEEGNLCIEDAGRFEDGIFKDCEIDVDQRTISGNAIAFNTLTEWYLFLQRYGDAAATIDIVLFATADVSLRITTSNATLIQVTIPTNLYTAFNSVRSANGAICIEYTVNQNSLFMAQVVESLVAERIKDKCENIMSIFHQLNDWDKTFTYLLFDTIAISNANRANFNTLAKTIYLDSISMNLNTLEEVEALLFGTAGFLSSIDNDCKYQQQLLEIFKQQESAYGIRRMKYETWTLPLKNDIWKLLSWLAALIHARISFKRIIYEEYDLNNIYRIMQRKVSPYWQRHHDFSGYEYPTDTAIMLSKSKIDIFIINAIVPMSIALNAQIASEESTQKSIGLMMKIKPEINFITKEWTKYGAKLDSAYQTQAVIQLHKKYCTQSLCHCCSLFSKMSK